MINYNSVFGKSLTPVKINGIEFDALITSDEELTATIPVYPIEDGFPVSDAIILNPISLKMTLYLSATPVTWMFKHGVGKNRVRIVCEKLKELWFEKKLVKIITNSAIYTNMGITSLSIKKSPDLRFDREIHVEAQKVFVTARQTTTVPSYILKSGETQANAGTAQTSGITDAATGTGVDYENESISGGSGYSEGYGGNSSQGASESKSNGSILYNGVSKVFGW